MIRETLRNVSTLARARIGREGTGQEGRGREIALVLSSGKGKNVTRGASR